MGTAFKAANYDVPPQFSAPFSGVSICREFSFNVAVALIVVDTIALCKLPGGTILENFFLDIPELDSGADAITLDVGDGTTVDRWLAASTIGQAGGKVSGLANAIAATMPAYIAANSVLTINVKVPPNVGTTPAISIRGWARWHYAPLAGAFPAAAA